MLTLDRLRVGSLFNCNLSLAPGLHVILGSEADGSAALADVLSGCSRPRSGAVRVSGRDPYRTPELRRRIAALLRDEELPPGRTLHGALVALLAAREISATPAEILARAGIGHWGMRKPETLSSGERRSVAAAIAFAIEAPLLGVLHEPLAYLPGLREEAPLECIERWLQGGGTVVCTTSSPRTAQALGASVLLLERGQLVRRVASWQIADFAPGQPVTLLVRTAAARELAAALSRHPAVRAVHFDEVQAPWQVRAQGDDAAELALAIAGAAREQGIAIHALLPNVPDLELTSAASAGYLRGAYDAGYRAAFSGTRG